MTHKALCNIKEVPYYFSRSSIKFQGHTGKKIDDLNPIRVRLLGRSQLSNPSDLPCLHLITIPNMNLQWTFETPNIFPQYLQLSPLPTWWRHQMETFSTLLALCAGNSPVTGEFPSQRPVKWSFDVFFDLSLNKQISKQSNRDAGDLRRNRAHYDVTLMRNHEKVTTWQASLLKMCQLFGM